MCKWNDTVNLRVKISARKSYTGQGRWDTKPIDRCLAPIVQALNDAGIYTEECCCGHGRGDGYLGLIDGRMFIIPLNGQQDWDEYRETIGMRHEKPETFWQRLRRVGRFIWYEIKALRKRA